MSLIAFSLMFSVREVATLPLESHWQTVSDAAIAAVVLVVGAAVLEESSIRWLIQRRLAESIGTCPAEALSNVVMLAFHWDRLGEWREMVFLLFMVFLCGRVVSLTGSVAVPIAIHASGNVTSILVTSYGRLTAASSAP